MDAAGMADFRIVDESSMASTRQMHDFLSSPTRSASYENNEQGQLVDSIRQEFLFIRSCHSEQPDSRRELRQK
jgi:hypothetical protein